jgi:catechol 2,3-dioxygenase-like lactoylglutathione lyase family enzyme
MRLKHVALVCNSEEKSDKFYQDLLGLEKSEPKTLPAALSKSIFNLDSELVIINYLNEHLHFEIFITDRSKDNTRQIEHYCLEVGNLEDFINKCRILGVETAQIPKGDRTLTFIRDFDGNLFEIKGR